MKRSNPFALVLLSLIFAGCGSTESPQPAEPPPTDTPSETAPSPAPAARYDFTGTWTMTRSVSSGITRENSDGLRGGKTPSDPFDWVLTIFMSGDGIRLFSVQGIDRGEMSDVTINAKGEMQFQLESSQKAFRCIASDPAKLVCVWNGHESQMRAEFRKRGG